MKASVEARGHAILATSKEVGKVAKPYQVSKHGMETTEPRVWRGAIPRSPQRMWEVGKYADLNPKLDIM